MRTMSYQEEDVIKYHINVSMGNMGEHLSGVTIVRVNECPRWKING